MNELEYRLAVDFSRDFVFDTDFGIILSMIFIIIMINIFKEPNSKNFDDQKKTYHEP